MAVTPHKVQEASKKLKKDPGDAAALKVVLEFVDSVKQDYYRPGEFYAVNTAHAGILVKELRAFLGPCGSSCYSKGCPGVLQFRDGTEACPFPDWGPLVRRALPNSMSVALRKIEELLTGGKARASVELVDGRWVHFRIDKNPPKVKVIKKKKSSS